MTSSKRRLLTGRHLWLLPALLGVLALLGPAIGLGQESQRQIIVIALLALCASGLNLAWGYGGELAVGQLAVYCLGAYITGWMSTQGYDLAWGLLASTAGAALIGLVVGLPALRISGWGLAMSSFFLIILIPNVLEILRDQTGGQIGMLGIQEPVLFGQPLSDTAFYVLVVVVLLAWLFVMRNLVVSRHGSALRVMRESPVLATSLGISVRRLKLTAYVLGAVPAGIAGALFAFVNRFLSPESFTFSAAILIIAASVLGGLETVYGAVIGATILTIGPNEIASFNEFGDIVFGVFLIVGGVVLSNTKVRLGIVRIKRAAMMWGDSPPEVAAGAGAVPIEAVLDAIDGAQLTVEGVSKSFGGNRAVNQVSLVAEPGRITALIGANGSGKTTLLNLISGYYRHDGGTISLGDQQLRTGKPVAVARLGVARTFQTPIIPQSMSTEEAVIVGRYVRDRCGMLPAMLRLPGYQRVRRRDRDAAANWLGATGLADHSAEIATALPLGSRRLVEVARAMATGARLLLLDEVASGLSADDIDILADLLRRVRDAGATVVLVEHNFALVSALADKIVVLERGEVISEGTPEHVRNDPAVARSYLGELADSGLDLPVETVGKALAPTYGGIDD